MSSVSGLEMFVDPVEDVNVKGKTKEAREWLQSKAEDAYGAESR